MNGQYNAGDTVLGNWKLSRLIGEGSFGRVFEAVREDFGTTYKAAIKIITIPQRQSEIKSARAEGMDEKSVNDYFRSFVEEIVREFALMSRLKGTANVVSYEDHTVIPHQGTIGWDIIIRMELLTPLLDHTSTKTFTRQDVTKLGIDICRALELCQKFNIIHRDIKPENIFISDLGDYKLGDFGIARTIEKTTSGLSKKGTYTYMAPEVYREGAYGSSVDIYSLGIVLYRLLNDNRAPFLPEYPAPITHSDREASLAKRISGAKLPEPKNADGRLAEIVLKACAYDSKDRYSSPMQMREELEAILYSREEAPIIYPNGDEAPIKSLDYVSTDAEHPAPIVNEATESVFGATVAPETTESVCELAAEYKTESMFDPIAIESQEPAPASINNDVTSETGADESSKSKKSPSTFYAAIFVAIIGMLIIGIFSDTLLNAIKSDSPDDIVMSPYNNQKANLDPENEDDDIKMNDTDNTYLPDTPDITVGAIDDDASETPGGNGTVNDGITPLPTTVPANTPTLITSDQPDEKPKILTRIDVAPPDMTRYYIGETFTSSGMVVTAIYSDNSKRSVTSLCTFSGFDSSTLGTRYITVSYKEDGTTKTAKFQIEIVKRPTDKPSITIGSINNITASSARVAFTVHNPSGLVISDFGCRLGITSGSGKNLIMGSINKSDGTINAAVTLQGLEPDTEFFFRVFVVNDDTAYYSDEHSLQTSRD